MATTRCHHWGVTFQGCTFWEVYLPEHVVSIGLCLVSSSMCTFQREVYMVYPPPPTEGTWYYAHPTPGRDLGPGISTPKRDMQPGTPSRKGPGTRYTHPWRDLGPGIPNFTVDRMTDRHLWKHYFPATSLASGNNEEQFIRPTTYTDGKIYSQKAWAKTSYLLIAKTHFI